MHIFQGWSHLGTSSVLDMHFVSCKPMDEVKVVQISGTWEVVLECIKCGSMVDHKGHPCCHVVLNRWGGGVLNATISLKSNFTEFQ